MDIAGARRLKTHIFCAHSPIGDESRRHDGICPQHPSQANQFAPETDGLAKMNDPAAIPSRAWIELLL
jgi:hypothetical protein